MSEFENVLIIDINKILKGGINLNTFFTIDNNILELNDSKLQESIEKLKADRIEKIKRLGNDIVVKLLNRLEGVVVYNFNSPVTTIIVPDELKKIVVISLKTSSIVGEHSYNQFLSAQINNDLKVKIIFYQSFSGSGNVRKDYSLSIYFNFENEDYIISNFQVPEHWKK